MPARLLVVDDDPQLTDGLKDILEDAGHIVYLASSGAAALAELQRSTIDLILLDYNLPDGKGIDWAQRYKETRPDIRILMMTGMSERDLPSIGGIQGFISKPIAPQDLLLCIHQALP